MRKRKGVGRGDGTGEVSAMGLERATLCVCRGAALPLGIPVEHPQPHTLVSQTWCERKIMTH